MVLSNMNHVKSSTFHLDVLVSRVIVLGRQLYLDNLQKVDAQCISSEDCSNA